MLLEEFVANRGGFKGIAWRTGLSMLKAARPGILERGVQKLLPEYLRALDPMYVEQQARNNSDFAGYMQEHPRRAAEALISIADTRIQGASEMAKKSYARFRDGAEHEVERLIPALSELIRRNLHS